MPVFRARHLLSLAILSGASLARGAPAGSSLDESLDEARAQGAPSGEVAPQSPHALDVSEPERGDGALRLSARRPGVWLRVSLDGAPKGEARREGGSTIYEGAGGLSVRLRRTAGGVEDYVRLPSRPAGGDRLIYRIELGPGARALRQIGNQLEVLDEGGVPRIHMDPPYLFGADRARHEVDVEVVGCAVDRSPAAPWRRPLVEPGATSCELRLSWAGARYPVLVDPAWRSTSGAMLFARQNHSAARLDSGDVLIAGGYSGAEAELYKAPAPGDYEDTGAFAATGSMPKSGMKKGAMAALPGGRAIFLGGEDKFNFDYEDSWIYDSAQGTWQTGPALSSGIKDHELVSLGDGRLIVAGGDVSASNALTAIYDPTQGPLGTWTEVTPMANARKKHGVAFSKGRVVVAGGEHNGSLLSSTEIYDVAKGTWSPGPSMGQGRRGLTATALLDGRVLLAGGNVGSAGGSVLSLNTVQALDPETKQISAMPAMNTLRSGHRAERLEDGRVLLLAGEGFIGWLPDAELYDPLAAGGVATQLFTVFPRKNHTLTWLGGMRALAAGGESNYVTVDTAEYFLLRPEGAPCGDDQSCLSLHCADEVCCAEACQGECEACSQKARGTAEPDGTCAARAAGAAPRAVPSPACVDESATNKCGLNGLCNGLQRGGLEACQLQPLGSRCSEQICDAPAYTFSVCDGQGACLLTQCAPYARCESADACATSCLLSGDCVAGHYCTPAGACEPKLGQGEPCASPDACASGHCVDDVCCDTACDGLCEACSVGKKGSGLEGACAPVAAGTPSPLECPPEGSVTCGKTGACNGSGACELYGPSTACAGDECKEQASGVSAIFSFRCQEGACVPQLTSSCGLAACGDKGACAASCSGPSDCAEGAYCEGSVCKARAADGEPCQQDASCRSGSCADGVCCNTSCTGQCESCNQPGQKGTCIAVQGSPPPGRPACGAAAGQATCEARRCDGAERKSCAGFVADETRCAEAACKPGSATLLLASSCAGNGLCRPQQELSCAPYACADGACKVSCQGDADCSDGTRCEAGLCVSSASCVGASTLRLADGSQRGCAPFRCDVQGRTCIERCASTADCVPGTACTGEGRCEAPLDAPADGGCSTSRPAPTGASWLLLAALLPLLRRRAWAALLAALPSGCSSAEPAGKPPAGEASEAGEVAEASDDLGSLRAELAAFGEAPGPWAAPRPPPWLRLPARADAPFELRDPTSGLSLAARLEGARPAPAARARGVLAYRGALDGGATLLHRPSDQGTEDFALIPGGSGLTSLSYLIELGPEVAGLRLVEGTLELIDRGGAPRIRIEKPYAIDERQRRVEVALEVEGCAVDTSPRGPWGRPPTAPGASRCRVRLAWGRQPGALLVDPAWVLTGTMSDPRALHTATLIAGGKVLVAGGGASLDDDGIAGSELYDPATGTWAKTGNTIVSHVEHGDWLLSDGRVLIAGGRSLTDDKVSEIYDPATGKWTKTGELSPGRYTQANGRLPDGRPFLCGGYTPNPDIFYDDAFIYSEATGTWDQISSHMIERRRYHRTFPLPDGRVLVGSGKIADSQDNEVISTSTELYDPITDTWTAGPAMKKGRQYAVTAATPDGILFAGGVSAGFPPVHTSFELFRYSTSSFVDLGNMQKGRVLGAAVWLAQEKKALIAGGADALGTTNSSELLATEATPTIDAGKMSTDRGGHTATLLDSGLVLIAGGGKATLGQLGSPTKTAELFSTLQIGQPCQSDGQCPQADPGDPASRHCVDGVCCTSACAGPCQACTAAKKGQGEDGTCASVAAATDPDNECTQDPENTCGRTGSCDGSGACELYKEGSTCARSCEAGQVTLGLCTQGSCKLSSSPCELYSCDPAAEACRVKCTSPSHCAPSAYCDLESETCKPRLAQGEPCQTAASCASGSCVDGFCCENDCGSPCRACAAALQQNAEGNGLCAPARADQDDPRGLCVEQSCVSRRQCDGNGACAPYKAGDTCSPAQCVGDSTIGYSLLEFSCDKGTCTSTQSDCGAFSCREGACLGSCQSASDCAPSAFCEGGKCSPLGDLGQACVSDFQCRSGHCADGVCCNTSCEGPCGHCKVAGQEGRCVPVDKPQPKHPACPTAPAGDPCKQRVCDGLATDTCEGYVGASQACGQAACATDPATQQGRESSASVCDGKGACGEITERNCFPFACGAAACLTECSADSQCAPGNSCVNKACVALLSCDPSRDVLLDLTGAVAKECGLYRCSTLSNACLSACETTADCRQGAACNGKKTCEIPVRSDNTDAGCGCRTAPSPSPAPPAPLLLLALAALRRRNRK